MHRGTVVAIVWFRFDRGSISCGGKTSTRLLATSNRLGILDLDLQSRVDGTMVFAWDLGLTAAGSNTTSTCLSNPQTNS
jgi:hypothetical protein